MEKFKQAIQLTRDNRWTSLRHWLISFVVCNFNVDVGPEIELVYPPDTKFSTADLSAICFNSFPERQDSELSEDAHFHFTIRNSSPDISLRSPSAPFGSPSLLFGNTVFRQEYDSVNKRSFSQKALVIISNHEFSSLFGEILKILTKSGFISDPTRLEAACSEISKWPSPIVGKQHLPFLGTVLEFEIAPHPSFPLQGLPPILAPVSETTRSIFAYEPPGSWSLILPSLASISELYTIFERMFLSDTVIVLAKTPQLCSQTVSAAIDFIRPVPYGGVCRPYLTMQSEFFLGSQDTGLPRHFVVGITNPFILKRIVSAVDASGNPIPHVAYLKNSNSIPPLKTSKSQRRRSIPSDLDLPASVVQKAAAKRYLKSDHPFLDSLEHLLKDNVSTSREIGPLVRRHFAELSAQLLAPLNRYLTQHMSNNVFSPSGNLQYANFSTADFLESLSKHGTSVRFKGQNPLQKRKARDAFYEAFCKSPNFYSWLDMKLTLEKEAAAGLLAEKSEVET